MYICMCVYISYVYICLYKRICTYSWMHADVHTDACVCVCVRRCLPTHKGSRGMLRHCKSAWDKTAFPPSPSYTINQVVQANSPRLLQQHRPQITKHICNCPPLFQPADRPALEALNSDGVWGLTFEAAHKPFVSRRMQALLLKLQYHLP